MEDMAVHIDVVKDLNQLAFAKPYDDRAYVVSGVVLKQLQSQLRMVDNIRYALREIGVQVADRP